MSSRSRAATQEADNFLRILDWQLFCAEQENRLWGYNPDVEWVPGDPIHKDPRKVTFTERLELARDSGDFTSTTIVGNHVRPMFETFYVTDNLHAVLDDPNSLFCDSCEVAWEMVDALECWVCGDISDRNRAVYDYYRRMREARKYREQSPIRYEAGALTFQTVCAGVPSSEPDLSLLLDEANARYFEPVGHISGTGLNIGHVDEVVNLDDGSVEFRGMVNDHTFAYAFGDAVQTMEQFTASIGFQVNNAQQSLLRALGFYGDMLYTIDAMTAAGESTPFGTPYNPLAEEEADFTLDPIMPQVFVNDGWPHADILVDGEQIEVTTRMVHEVPRITLSNSELPQRLLHDPPPYLRGSAFLNSSRRRSQL